MGDVWHATDTVLGRTVAVKILRPDLSADGSFGARFRAEAHTLATLRHPGVVDVYDYGEISSPNGVTDVAYLVMAYVEGEPLSRRLDTAGPLLPGETMTIVAQVADALAAVHAAGIVHRDVKPDNVVINPDGNAVLVDFGVAHTPGTNGMTAAGDVIGTALYMAPEQALQRPITAATDIYALACLAYECLAGVPPFTGENAVAVALAHVHGKPAPLPDDVPVAVRDVVTTGMAKSPAHRYPSAAAMVAAARRSVRSAGATAGRGVTDASPATMPLHATRWRAGIAAVRPAGVPPPATSRPATATWPIGASAQTRPHTGRRAVVIAATAAAAALIAVLVAMAQPGTAPLAPGIHPPATVTGTSEGSAGAGTPGRTRTAAPTAPGAPAPATTATATAGRTAHPTSRRPTHSTAPPTIPPTSLIPSILPSLPGG